VRVTDMRHVDLERYRFDFDLTFAILLMHPDGTVYHRYGSRDWTGPLAWVSMDSLVSVMKQTLADHRAYSKNPSPPKLAPKRTVDEMAAFQKRRAKPDACVHCHTVHEVEREEAMAAGRFDRDEDIWVFPPPQRVGLTLDSGDQSLVLAVEPGSPADKAGIEAGDRLIRSGRQRLRTIHDLQWVLDRASKHKTEVALEIARGRESKTVVLKLAAGWKHGTPRTYAWRAYKWRLTPAPGFGGKPLGAGEITRLGLSADTFAFRITYLVTWGPLARTGRNAARAGLRKGDVVYSLAGKTDFDSMNHFHAWFRLTQKAGTKIKVGILRAGQRKTIVLPVVD